MKAANSKVLYRGEIDAQSIKHAFAYVELDDLKRTAQKLRGVIDWDGRGDKMGLIYDCAMEVIHIQDPAFATEYSLCL
jgi:hypothetical protein